MRHTLAAGLTIAALSACSSLTGGPDESAVARTSATPIATATVLPSLIEEAIAGVDAARSEHYEGTVHFVSTAADIRACSSGDKSGDRLRTMTRTPCDGSGEIDEWIYVGDRGWQRTNGAGWTELGQSVSRSTNPIAQDLHSVLGGHIAEESDEAVMLSGRPTQHFRLRLDDAALRMYANRAGAAEMSKGLLRYELWIAPESSQLVRLSVFFAFVMPQGSGSSEIVLNYSRWNEPVVPPIEAPRP